MSEYTIAHESPLFPGTLQVYGGSPLIGSLALLQEPPAHGQSVDLVLAVGPEGLALLIVTETTSPLTVACRTDGLPLRSCRGPGVLTYTPAISFAFFDAKGTAIKVNIAE